MYIPPDIIFEINSYIGNGTFDSLKFLKICYENCDYQHDKKRIGLFYNSQRLCFMENYQKIKKYINNEMKYLFDMKNSELHKNMCDSSQFKYYLNKCPNKYKFMACTYSFSFDILHDTFKQLENEFKQLENEHKKICQKLTYYLKTYNFNIGAFATNFFNMDNIYDIDKIYPSSTRKIQIIKISVPDTYLIFPYDKLKSYTKRFLVPIRKKHHRIMAEYGRLNIK